MTKDKILLAVYSLIILASSGILINDYFEILSISLITNLSAIKKASLLFISIVALVQAAVAFRRIQISKHYKHTIPLSIFKE